MRSCILIEAQTVYIMKQKLKQFWQWLRKNILNKEMILPVIIAEAIFWSPVIVCGIFALILSPWWWSIVSAYILLWAGPLTPAVPLQIGLALLIKKIMDKIRGKKK